MANKSQLRSVTQVSGEEKTAVPPQVSLLIHREVMDKFGEGEQQVLVSLFGSGIFHDFIRKQMEIVQKQTTELNPRAYKPEDFVQLSSDFRLVWRFWYDLLQFAEEYKPERA